MSRPDYGLLTSLHSFVLEFPRSHSYLRLTALFSDPEVQRKMASSPLSARDAFASPDSLSTPDPDHIGITVWPHRCHCKRCESAFSGTNNGITKPNEKGTKKKGKN